jgi:hypothetical protein
MSCTAAKSEPCLLTDERTQICVDVSEELLIRGNEDENFLQNIITGDET